MHWQRKRLLATLGATLLLALVGLAVSNPCEASLIDLTPTNGVNSNDSVSMADLASGEVMGIKVGDKIFTGFSYSPNNANRFGDMPSPDDVRVLGFKDPAGNWGLTFHGAFLDLPGGGASDALIRFMVEVDPQFLERGVLISDAHLFLGGVGVGENSFFAVDESFLESNETLSVIKSSINQGAKKLSDWAFFDPLLGKLNVAKDIVARAADDSAEPARASVIDQSFSQNIIPEPTAIVLAMIGLAACGLARRRPSRRRLAT